MPSGFVILEHPADLGIEARGRNLAEAFQNAATGLMSVILDLSLVDAHESRRVSVHASDHEQLLVRWLSEVLYLYDGMGFVGKDFHIREISGTTLTATISGEPFTLGKHQTHLDVKAVTYHQLVVQAKEEGALVRVYLDI